MEEGRKAGHIYQQFLRTIDRFDMIRAGDSVVAGVSGGPDSVALLHMLVRLRRKRRVRLCVAHLNHMTRGAETDEEQAFVADLARRWRVKFFTQSVNVHALADARKVGLEEAARDIRYEFYADVAAQTGASRIALGHHADDNAETVLYRILRGTGVRGLAGIPPVRPLTRGSEVKIVRPLSDLTAAGILAYLKDHNLPSRFDSSNASLDFARNRIRLKILPELERRGNADIRRALARLARSAWQIDRWMQREVERLLEDAEALLKGGVWEFRPAWFASIPEPIATEVLREMLRRLDVRMGRFGREHFESIARLARAPKGSASLRLPDGVQMEKEQARVILRKGPAPAWRPPARPIPMQVPGVTELPHYEGTVFAEVADGGLADLAPFLESKGVHEEMLDYDMIESPLAVRSWRDGDRFRPLGAPGTRKLQDFMTDLKIPRAERKRIPIVTMSDRPIWLVGWRIADSVKVTSRTRRILHLRFESNR